MSNRDLLLEIGLEEMPARFIGNAITQLEEKMLNWLDEKGIRHGAAQGYSSPRRLAVLVSDVEEYQEDTEEKAKGPAKKIALDAEGKWSKAAEGFSRSHGMTPDDIFFEEIKGVEYAHIKRFIKGEATAELLSGLEDIVRTMQFPNNMRWGDHQLKYLRPIRWITALFGHEVISFEIASVQSGSRSHGHRFLGETAVLHTADNYETALKEQFVIADQNKRQRLIEEQIKGLENEHGWKIPVEEELLQEVTNLVEYPTAFFGAYDEKYLALPEDVLITSMKNHQRYFPVQGKSQDLLPYFVAVRNGNSDHLEQVAKGNEKVLHARLADAEFFYEEDKKLSIDEALSKLEAIVYHEKIGTLAQKVQRVRRIAALIASMLDMSAGDKELVDRAAAISKFDLVTNMVDEFPELQGIMGEKYALMQGEQPEAAKAVNEHYMPRFAGDQIPSTLIGAIIAVADRLDTVVSSFAINLIPTGSNDPYALRRSTAGIISILDGMNWNISLEELLEKVVENIRDDVPAENDDLTGSLIRFFKLRLKHTLAEKHIRHDIVEAVLGVRINGIPDLIARASTLENEKNGEGFKESIESLARVLNIAQKAPDQGEVDASLFENQEEEILYQAYLRLKERLASEKNVQARFSAMADMKPAITAYFDHTMVMADDDKVKMNRLAQMRELAELIKTYALMNEILVK